MKEKVKKISDNIYEIPKIGKMLVPGRMYTSKKLFDNVEENAITQIVNVAQLPGIKGYSFAMPDVHSGYGFPIGGVAAFDIKTGIISPGGVGYDINCTHPDSIISLENGMWIKMKDLEEKWQEINLKFSDLNNFKINETNLNFFMKREENGYLYEVKTKTGHIIKVTGDHPIFTKEGMKEAKHLSLNDLLVVHSFIGNKYEDPSNDIILSEKDIKGVLDKLGITSKGHAREQIINKISNLNILPLRYSSKELPVLLKIMGFVFGDGYLNVENSKQTQFYGVKEDLELIKKDIEKIGFKCSIFSREREHKIKTHYKEYGFSRTEHMLKSQSRSLAVLLYSLGTPAGNKTSQGYRIPEWIFKAPLWQKRLFLSSFFGAELSSPKTVNKYNFYSPQLNMNKLETLKENAIDFLNDIGLLLMNFGVATSPIVEVPGYHYKGKKGDTIGFRLKILSNPINYSQFLRKIGYEYNMEKQKKACLAANYIKLKEKIVNEREIIRKQSVEMYEQKIPIKEIITRLEGRYATQQFIEHSVWSERQGVRIAFNFMSFEEYSQKYALGNSGLAWDEIEEIKKIPYSGLVYDVNMNDNNHNFIANGFVVSNCGVRLLTTGISKEEFMKKRKEALHDLNRGIPSGVGRGGSFQFTKDELNKILEKGSQYVVEEKKLGTKDDLDKTESNGCIKGADSDKVSDRAKKRGIGQLGTLGAGNHFVEVQYVETIYDDKAAEIFGLKKDDIVIMIHTGSRGLGHQTASDYIHAMEKEYGFENLPDRELIAAPIESKLGEDYMAAMAGAANFAFANRQIIMNQARKSFEHQFPNAKVKLVYDVAHNIAKFEYHVINGKKMKVCIHRKGATRSFGQGNKEIPKEYQPVGQPVIIPGSMGTYSYVLVGTKKAEEVSFSSTAHGAGRVHSRTYAKKNLNAEKIKKELEDYGVLLQAGSVAGMLEEAPEVYKDINEVVRVSHELGIGNLVVRLKPLAVIKG